MFLLIAVASCSATTIEPNPSKQKGAGPLFKIHYGDKWGFMDRRGHVVIRPQFESVGDFFDGLALVGKEDKYCFIDESGRTVIPCRFDAAGRFSQGLAPVRIGRLWGYINRLGQFVVQPRFQGAAEFRDGMGRIEIWARILCPGQTFTNEDAPLPLFAMRDETFQSTSGCFPENPRFGFVDGSGQLVIRPEFFMAQDFSEGLAGVRAEESATSLWAFIDKAGKIAIPAAFDQASSFSEGLAAVETGARFEPGQQVAGKWGFINRSGSLVIAPQFEFAGSFAEGLARVCKEPGAWGFINYAGQVAIMFRYEAAGDFSEGLAAVWDGSPPADDDAAPPSFYIDRTGKKVLRLKGGRWPFSDGLTVAGEDEKRVYINKKGRVVARYEITGKQVPDRPARKGQY